LLTTFALLIASCTSNSATTTTVLPLTPPQSPSTAADSPSIPSTPDAGLSIQPIEGFLPDGTDYIVYLETPSPESLEAITGDIMYEIDGQIWWAAEVEFVPEERLSEVEVLGNVYRIPAGQFWATEIAFSDRFLEFLGDESESVILDSIAGFDRQNSSTLPFPVLDLTPPFRWSTEFDPTGPMEVRYSTIIVRPGCDQDAEACTETEILSVHRRPGYQARSVGVETFTARLLSDRDYLDPGPLSPRIGHDVLWTGTEMIVWGGTFADGAAFDPKANTWRVLANAPFPDRAQTDAVWAGDEMIVVTADGTFGYDPVTDSWRDVSDFATSDGYAAQMVWVVDKVFVWFDFTASPTGAGFAGTLFEVDIDSEAWTEISDPGLGNGSPWSVHMTEWQGQLLVSSNPSDRCFGHEYWVWDGEEWEELPHVSLQWSDQLRDCSMANQVAVIGDEILVWADENYFTKIFRDDEWVRVERIPGGGGESPPSALVIGDRVLVTDGRALVYDPAADTWVIEPMPGSVWSARMVWTGTEVLAWDGTGGRDAWRWTPPE